MKIDDNVIKGLDNLVSILGSKNVKRIQDEITDSIIENIKSAVDEYYVIPPEEFTNMISEFYVKIGKQLLKNHKNEITAEIEKLILNKLEGLNHSQHTC